MKVDIERIDGVVLALLYLGLHQRHRTWKVFDRARWHGCTRWGSSQSPLARRSPWLSPIRDCGSLGGFSKPCSRGRPPKRLELFVHEWRAKRVVRSDARHPSAELARGRARGRAERGRRGSRVPPPRLNGADPSALQDCCTDLRERHVGRRVFAYSDLRARGITTWRYNRFVAYKEPIVRSSRWRAIAIVAPWETGRHPSCNVKLQQFATT